MLELLKSVDNWFLIIVITLLGGWFVWSIRKIFTGLEESIKDLNKTIAKLFDNDKNFEHRLSTLEGEHKAKTCLAVREKP